ncbi:hypothetical protein ACFPOI_24605 [Nonomuraea angiospora]|uniref:Uncharacterized protein n=1 Tax=Nonomuraea angiospora TaxID=46172 RepID=A0ABR9MMQ5_9ACTN|nr:hypothetical protein [Nonomuraea angiospora]MBE1593860.1 hypothetical protein [Nonomuraea angiospora]
MIDNPSSQVRRPEVRRRNVDERGVRVLAGPERTAVRMTVRSGPPRPQSLANPL